ncbi:LCP family protein [Dactylosporangium sp. McL0621]|uniref:LCP family protein n=1 Tax=Dactylosporangium sp. McL0621 TaxID=3415678 RepID=UPI003CE6A0BF
MKAWLVTAAVVLSVALGATLTWRHYAGRVDPADLLGDTGRDRTGPRQIDIRTAPRLSGGPFASGADTRGLDAEPGRNILLAGLDARPAEDRSTARADTVIIVHVTEADDRAYLISLPRDTRVTIPGHGPDKLNAAFQYGGFELLARTVQQLTGPVFDAGAIIDFAGLRKVVDAVGGVAIAGKVTSAGVLANPLALNRAVTAVGDSLTFDGNGAPVTDWIVRLRAIGPDDLTLLSTNAGRFNTEQRDGRDYENLDPATADLFTAARDDRVGEFARRHPDRVITR